MEVRHGHSNELWHFSGGLCKGNGLGHFSGGLSESSRVSGFVEF